MKKLIEKYYRLARLAAKSNYLENYEGIIWEIIQEARSQPDVEGEKLIVGDEKVDDPIELFIYVLVTIRRMKRKKYAPKRILDLEMFVNSFGFGLSKDHQGHYETLVVSYPPYDEWEALGKNIERFEQIEKPLLDKFIEEQAKSTAGTTGMYKSKYMHNLILVLLARFVLCNMTRGEFRA